MQAGDSKGELSEAEAGRRAKIKEIRKDARTKEEERERRGERVVVIWEDGMIGWMSQHLEAAGSMDPRFSFGFYNLVMVILEFGFSFLFFSFFQCWTQVGRSIRGSATRGPTRCRSLAVGPRSRLSSRNLEAIRRGL